MAKIPARVTNIAIGAVVIEDDVSTYSLAIDQETPVVTGLSDIGERVVAANYKFGLDLGLNLDFAAAQSDATIFGHLGSQGVAMAVDPTGGAAGANDPNYDATAIVLSNYTISGGVGQAVTGSAKYVGNSALTRAVA